VILLTSDMFLYESSVPLLYMSPCLVNREQEFDEAHQLLVYANVVNV